MIDNRQIDYPMNESYPSTYVPSYDVEGKITNIVAQIDPATIIDNLDHALKGETWNKEKGEWSKMGGELVNDACRTSVINYLTSKLNNNTTMGTLDEKRVSLFMEGVIDGIRRLFVCNLERFGFVPEGEFFEEEIYYNKGTPDSARMTLVCDMIFMTVFMVLSRSIKGSESNKIFRSLSLNENMGYNQMNPQQERAGFFGRLFGRR